MHEMRVTPKEKLDLEGTNAQAEENDVLEGMMCLFMDPMEDQGVGENESS
jgi:hypothetical protein